VTAITVRSNIEKSCMSPPGTSRTLRNVRYLVGYWGQSGTTEIYEYTP
jgi:hypothetical protein